MSPYSKVLVAVDLSANSLPALEEALKFQEAGAEVSCLHVVPESGEEARSFKNFYQEQGAEENILENYALPWLENWLSDVDINLPGTIQLQARVGEPYETILDVADQGGYELIVIGTHGRRGLERYWMGSVAENVIRRSECPVLTVRAKDPNPEIIEE